MKRKDKKKPAALSELLTDTTQGLQLSKHISLLQKPVFIILEASRGDYVKRNGLKYGLTTREIEIAGLLEKGNTYKTIAQSLNIALKTVEKHIQNIYRKLGVSSRHELYIHLNTDA